MAVTEKKSLTSIQTPLKPIYVLQGTQEYLIHRLRKSIIEKAVAPADRDFNVSIYDMNETSLEVAIEDAMTLPFLGENRVIVLENPLFLTGDTKKMKIDHDLDALMTYIENPSPTTILVIEAPYEKLDKRKKMVKLLESKGTTYEFNQISDKDLFHLLKEEANDYKVTYSEQAHERLLALVGFQVAQLVSEIHKLSLFVGEGGEIARDDVDQLATRSLESNVFDLVDHVMRGRLEKALFLLEDLYKQKEEPIRLLALVMRQVRLLLQTQLLQEQGYAQKQIASRLKLHPYAVKIASEQGKRFEGSQLKKALIWCSDMDYAMKMGVIDKELALQLLIHQISRLSISNS